MNYSNYCNIRTANTSSGQRVNPTVGLRGCAEAPSLTKRPRSPEAYAAGLPPAKRRRVESLGSTVSQASPSLRAQPSLPPLPRAQVTLLDHLPEDCLWLILSSLDLEGALDLLRLYPSLIESPLFSRYVIASFYKLFAFDPSSEAPRVLLPEGISKNYKDLPRLLQALHEGKSFGLSSDLNYLLRIMLTTLPDSHADYANAIHSILAIDLPKNPAFPTFMEGLNGLRSHKYSTRVKAPLVPLMPLLLPASIESPSDALTEFLSIRVHHRDQFMIGALSSYLGKFPPSVLIEKLPAMILDSWSDNTRRVELIDAFSDLLVRLDQANAEPFPLLKGVLGELARLGKNVRYKVFLKPGSYPQWFVTLCTLSERLRFGPQLVEFVKNFNNGDFLKDLIRHLAFGYRKECLDPSAAFGLFLEHYDLIAESSGDLPARILAHIWQEVMGLRDPADRKARFDRDVLPRLRQLHEVLNGRGLSLADRSECSHSLITQAIVTDYRLASKQDYLLGPTFVASLGSHRWEGTKLDCAPWRRDMINWVPRPEEGPLHVVGLERDDFNSSTLSASGFYCACVGIFALERAKALVTCNGPVSLDQLNEIKAPFLCHADRVMSGQQDPAWTSFKKQFIKEFQSIVMVPAPQQPCPLTPTIFSAVPETPMPIDTLFSSLEGTQYPDGFEFSNLF